MLYKAGMGFKQLPLNIQQEVTAQVEYYKSTGQTPNSERRKAQFALQQQHEQHNQRLQRKNTSSPAVSITGTGYIGMRPPKDIVLALEATKINNETTTICNNDLQLPKSFPITTSSILNDNNNNYNINNFSIPSSGSNGNIPLPPPMPLYSPSLNSNVTINNNSSRKVDISHRPLNRKYVDVFSNPDVLV